MKAPTSTSAVNSSEQTSRLVNSFVAPPAQNSDNNPQQTSAYQNQAFIGPSDNQQQMSVFQANKAAGKSK